VVGVVAAGGGENIEFAIPIQRARMRACAGADRSRIWVPPGTIPRP
jgi:hypothetical protein